MVHAAFPNVKMLAERSLVWPDDHVTLGDDEEKIPEPADNIRIWISVRNNVSDAANTSQTMAKVIAAILEFSDLQYPTVSDYADDIVALPAFATRYDPAGDNVDREVFLEYTRRISVQSPLISRLPPQVAETTFAGLFDAHKAGTLSSYPSALKPHFDMIMNDIVKRTESDGCLLRMEGIGTVGVHTLFDKKSPNVHREVVSVTYKLFQQLNRLFSTEMNRECYGPMRCSVRCETFKQAEQWLQRVSRYVAALHKLLRLCPSLSCSKAKTQTAYTRADNHPRSWLSISARTCLQTNCLRTPGSEFSNRF